MLEFAAVRPVAPVTLIAGCDLCIINSDHTHTDWLTRPGLAFEVLDLMGKITLYPVDLFDHCFSEDFNLNADFDSGNRSSSNLVARVDLGFFAHYEL